MQKAKKMTSRDKLQDRQTDRRMERRADRQTARNIEEQTEQTVGQTALLCTNCRTSYPITEEASRGNKIL